MNELKQLNDIILSDQSFGTKASLVREWLKDNAIKGDIIAIKEEDGKFYDYTCVSWGVRAGIEWEAYLPSTLAPETNGIVATSQMNYWLLKKEFIVKKLNGNNIQKEGMDEALNQYYGINNNGQTVYVAMSEQEVENYAKKHPEEKIIRVEDKWGSIKKSLREYIEPAYTGSGHKVKDAVSDKFNIGDRVQFDDGDWKNRTGTIKDIFENNHGVICAKVTFDKSFKNHPGGKTMALKSLRKLDESFTRKTLRESLKDWDRKEFRDNSRSFELEMLYESVKTTLSAQQKNDLARFIRKAKTAEEVNTYMTGMIAKDNVKESFTEDIDEESFNKLKEIAYELDNYIEDKVWVRDFWYDAQFDNTITFSISGDWKHDHLRFNYYASEWLDNRGIDYKISEHITDDSEDDSYDADHTIRIYNLKEL